MRNASLVFVTLLLAFPVNAFAESCSTTGYTIILVNGIFNTEERAEEGATRLQNLLQGPVNNERLTVKPGYNPSHIGGLGDVIQSVTQAFHSSIGTFDRDSILMKMHSQVKTRKLLLVGHSQGTYYTNELYKYLTDHGVPKESIGVYNIATPASYVAGGGGYVTSTNDKIINLIRSTQVGSNANLYKESYYTINHVVDSALRANITVAPEAGHADNFWGGHKLSVYLDGAAPRIMGDINASLQRLKATGPDTEGSCFEPPQEDLAYKTKSLLYAVVDPLAVGTKTVAMSLKGGAEDFTDYVAGGINETKYFAQSLFKTFASSNANNTNQAAAAALAKPQITVAKTTTLPKETQAQQVVKATQVVEQNATQPLPPNEPENTSQVQEDPPPTQPEVQFHMTPGFGGGGEAASVADVPSSTAALNITSPAGGAHVATSSVVFLGTAESGVLITATYGTSTATTTADGMGAWTLALVLPEGTTTVNVQATNSSVVTRAVTVDTIAPAVPTIAISECARSIVAAYCVVPSATVTLQWSSSDASSYTLYRGGVSSGSFTATSSSQSLSSSATSSFKIVAYDLAGNAATSSAVSVYATMQPIRINEIGWGGTDTGTASGQQWIELKNMTTLPIDLTNFSIARSNGETILLTGATLAAGEKIVIEQSDLSTAAGSELVVAFSDLPTTASEQLTLSWGGIIVDATPAVGACASWCKGKFYVPIGSNVSGATGVTSSLSMERLGNGTDGTLAVSWQTYDGYEAMTWGSAGTDNSNGLPDSGVYCGAVDNLITPGTVLVPFNPGNTLCFYLSQFISGGPTGAHRYAALYQGSVGSSTRVVGTSLQKQTIGSAYHPIPGVTPAGTEHFYAIYETPSSISGVTTLFTNYFQFGEDTGNGGNPPPHGNYVTIPFTYQP